MTGRHIPVLYQKQEEDRAVLKAKEEEIEKLNAQNQALGKRLSELERPVAQLASNAPDLERLSEPAEPAR